MMERLTVWFERKELERSDYGLPPGKCGPTYPVPSLAFAAAVGVFILLPALVLLVVLATTTV